MIFLFVRSVTNWMDAYLSNNVTHTHKSPLFTVFIWHRWAKPYSLVSFRRAQSQVKSFTHKSHIRWTMYIYFSVALITTNHGDVPSHPPPTFHPPHHRPYILEMGLAEKFFCTRNVVVVVVSAMLQFCDGAWWKEKKNEMEEEKRCTKNGVNERIRAPVSHRTMFEQITSQLILRSFYLCRSTFMYVMVFFFSLKDDEDTM